jgi:hypothetical protein
VAQTKHRTVRVDRNDPRFDEEEQRMHVKDHRKNKINNIPEYLDDLDDCPYQDDIEYLLRKNR